MIYFFVSPQKTKRIIYSDGPHVLSMKDSVYKIIHFEPINSESSSPNILINYDTVRADQFFNDVLKIEVNQDKIDEIYSVFLDVDSVFSVGDIHGEYQSLLILLKNNDIITENGDWNFGKGHLVFCGDIFDRGEKVTETLWFVYKLEQQAKEQGGNVHYLIGNHELMALTGDHRYLHEKYRHIQNKIGIKYSFVYNKNTLLGKWLREKNSVIKINDVLYVHGGLHPDIINMNLSLFDINQFIRNYLNSTDFNDSIRFLINKTGPLWYRGFLEENDDVPLINDNEIDEILNYFNAEKIVFAHTKVKNIKSLNKNKLFAIDVPMSMDKGEGLFINSNQLYSVDIKGKKLIEFNL